MLKPVQSDYQDEIFPVSTEIVILKKWFNELNRLAPHPEVN